MKNIKSNNLLNSNVYIYIYKLTLNFSGAEL